MESHTSRLGTVKVGISDICRFYLRSEAYYRSIFLPHEALRMSIGKAIEGFLNLEVAENDDLPGTVCDQCSRKLTEYHEFKEMCVKSATRLRSYVPGISVKGSGKGNLTPVVSLVEVESSSWHDVVKVEFPETAVPGDPLALGNPASVEEGSSHKVDEEGDRVGDEGLVEKECLEGRCLL